MGTRSRLWLWAAFLTLTGCAETCQPVGGDGGPLGPDAGPGGFDDHTVRVLRDTDAFFDLAAGGQGLVATKFVITQFDQPPLREVRYYDANFYTLHDEWYWFRLLNGASVSGDTTTPYPGSFDSISAIYDWARETEPLPLDLRWVSSGARLYSPRFYQLGLGTTPRKFGLGTLVYLPARTEEPIRDEIWAFELEFTDAVDHAQLVTFFDQVSSTVASDIASELHWLVRSPVQEELAVQMETSQLLYHDRILRYRDLTVPGETEVYAEGLTAGRVRIVADPNDNLDDPTQRNSILFLGFVPDFLPPGAGLVTAIPQTPLAHINVLAKNRGIPNAYLGGFLEDPNLEQLGRVNAPIIIRARAPDLLDLVPITESEYSTWRSLVNPPPIQIPQVPLGNAPYAISLQSIPATDVDNLRPLIGGKSAGFIGLLRDDDADLPDWPLALTARAYAEHLAPIMPRIEGMLLDLDFRVSSRTRFLVLEGEPAFLARYNTEEDAAFLELFSVEHGEGDVLGDLVREGGLGEVIRTADVPAATLAAVRDVLETNFAPLAASQGLRFRSSATIEDIEGFNGAGLYTSNTGFLFPDPDEERTVAHALKATWSSYWGAEAFEERELANIEHLDGHMAVLVHSRFDDDLERSNGVFTFTVLPDDVEDQGVLELNVQRGSLSVTNPPPGLNVLPEVNRLTRTADGSIRIDRVAGSSELPEGDQVLTDAQLLDLFAHAEVITAAWLDDINEDYLSAQRQRTLTLDFEFREMGVGWPALQNGNNFGRRMIIKQARTLSPSLLVLPQHIKNLPMPRDVIARARRVLDTDCSNPSLAVSVTDVFTDPLMPPNLGHDLDPFLGYITIQVLQDLGTGHQAGDSLTLVHVQLDEASHPGMDEGGPWTVSLSVAPAYQASLGLTSLSIAADRSYTLTSASGTATGVFDACAADTLFASAAAFLEDLIAEKEGL